MSDTAQAGTTSIDELTGLPNREFLVSAVGTLLGGPLTRRRPLSLLLFDIDHFRQVNDTLGRDVGDRVLIKVAGILRCNVKSGDPVVRCVRDEFVIVLEDVAKDVAEKVAQRVSERVSDETLEVAGRKVDLAVTASVATFPEDGTDLRALLESAYGTLKARRAAVS